MYKVKNQCIKHLFIVACNGRTGGGTKFQLEVPMFKRLRDQSLNWIKKSVPVEKKNTYFLTSKISWILFHVI